MFEKQTKPSEPFRNIGVTASERYLKKLCDRSFLSLWSYSSVYRDQGKGGKELCDVLVVFENDIIIFSDKYCKYPDTGNPDLDWNRWYRRAVQEAADQIWGAERWIKSHPDRIFLDPQCQHPFPLTIPKPEELKIHRVVVAHGASTRCKKALGGSGSLMIDSSIKGQSHYNTIDGVSPSPFTIGQVDPSRGYVHVFDDTTLDIVLTELDTIRDFTDYLSRKERLVSGKRLVWAAGEEELLAYYLQNTDTKENHYFPFDSKLAYLILNEGLWDGLSNSPKFTIKNIANDISYMWDDLIEKLNHYLIVDESYDRTHLEIKDTEILHRFMAREPRAKRRILARALFEFIMQTPHEVSAARIVKTDVKDNVYYVFCYFL